MKFKGWDDSPSDFQCEFNFHRGPKWLLLLSHIPYFERYAYPKAIELGLAEAWPREVGVNLEQSFDSNGWIIHDSPKDDFERWVEGSLAFLTQKKKSSLTRFLLTRRTIHITGNLVIFWHVLPRFSLTRYGSHIKFQRDIHRLNGTYKDYKRALRGERFDFSG